MPNNQTAKRITLTSAQQEVAVARYIAGEGAPEIAKDFGVCSNNIRNAVRRAGHSIRSKVEAVTKYALNRAAFDVITPEAAYWIGFLFADGSIYEKNRASPVLSLTVATVDREHLVKLKTFLGTDRPIYEGSSVVRGVRHSQVTVMVSSTQIAEALWRNGMNKKSLERVATPELARSRDFWRGLVDGDGFVSTGDKPKLGVCGGRTLMRQFLDYFQNLGIGLDTSIAAQTSANLGQKTPKTIYLVTFACDTAVRAAKHLYSNAVIALDRKEANARSLW